MLILGSGNIVHNLRTIDPSQADAAFDWAQRFDDAVGERLMSNPEDVAVLTEHRDYDLAVPTPDHYLPLLYIAGLAHGEPLTPLINGHWGGSISMTSYAVGMTVETSPGSAGTSVATLPKGVDPLSTNM